MYTHTLSAGVLLHSHQQPYTGLLNHFRSSLVMLWRSALRPLLVSLDCEGYSSKQWSETGKTSHWTALRCEGYSNKQWSETEGTSHWTALRCEGYGNKQWSETESKHLTGLPWAVMCEGYSSKSGANLLPCCSAVPRSMPSMKVKWPSLLPVWTSLLPWQQRED